MESKGKKKSSASPNMLAPGFRFHPTDEELVRYYLRRKVCGKTFQLDAIAEIDIYKAEPWDLPSMSKLKTRDLEWYFFSALDRKYGNGSRTNRATEKGYWKTTGKDREVYHKKQIVGMKKTLVYHNGRAPKGQRSNWVMHEYRLADLELEGAGISQDAFVLCRVFNKSGSGPKNGEQYGAPFVEEEWENNELESVPKVEALEEVDFGGDAYLDGDYLEQILGSDVSSEITHPQLNFQSADGSHGDETAESVSDTQKLLDCADQLYYGQEHLDDTNLYGLPTPYDMNVNLVKHEYIGESSKSGNSEDVDYLLDEPFLDSTDYLPFGSEGFIETNDLSNPVEANTSAFNMFEEYLTFLDANDDYSQNFVPDPASILGSEAAPVSDDTSLCHKEPNEGIKQDVIPSGQIVDNTNDYSASPSHNQEPAKYQSDFKYPFLKQASQMLGNIPAPPAFAEEFPLKKATAHFNYMPQTSSSVHFTAGMIQLRNLTVGNNGTVPSRKHENLNIVLSFGFSRGEDGSANLESSVSIHPGKMVSAINRDWFYLIFLCVLVLSMSFKIGVMLCAN